MIGLKKKHLAHNTFSRLFQVYFDITHIDIISLSYRSKLHRHTVNNMENVYSITFLLIYKII